METREFTIEHDGKTYEFVAKLPTKEQEIEAQRVYNKSWKDAVKSGCMLKDAVIDTMMENGLWTDEQEKAYRELIKSIAGLEYKLNSGKDEKGNKLKLSEGNKLALEVKSLRFLLREMSMKLGQFDSVTAEGMAEQAQFEYMVSVCVVDNTTMKPFFTSHEDYLSRSHDELTVLIAGKFASILYGLSENYEDDLVENKFLRRFKFADEKNRLINKDGELVDTNGDRVDEEGYRLNESGKRIDVNGNELLEDGVSVETVDFEDDLEEKPKRGRKKATD